MTMMGTRYHRQRRQIRVSWHISIRHSGRRFIFSYKSNVVPMIRPQYTRYRWCSRIHWYRRSASTSRTIRIAF